MQGFLRRLRANAKVTTTKLNPPLQTFTLKKVGKVTEA